MVKCPECASENKSDSKFCHNCGTKLDSRSPSRSDSDVEVIHTTNDKEYPGHDSYYEFSKGSNSSKASKASKAPGSFIDAYIEKFKSMGTIKKIVTACCAVFLVLMVLSVVSRLALGLPLDYYTEAEGPSHDYSFMDLDGDGALCLEEFEIEYSNVSSSELEQIFEKSDKNGNGLIKGAEYDMARYLINEHFKSLEKKKTQSKKSSSKSSSSSSSGSNYNPFPLVSDDGYETCPYCGSEAIYESGNSYRCAECGRSISNPDDLNLNYEEGYY